MTKTGFAHGALRSIVERIERLEEEKRTLAGDIREVYAEAKGHGFDVKTIRRAVKHRAQDATQREEADALFDLYLRALEQRTATVVPMQHAAAAE